MGVIREVAVRRRLLLYKLDELLDDENLSLLVLDGLLKVLLATGE